VRTEICHEKVSVQTPLPLELELEPFLQLRVLAHLLEHYPGVRNAVHHLSYTLRPVIESDRAWLRALHHAAIRDAVEAMWGWDEQVQDELFEKGFTPEHQSIVHMDGQDVGVIGVTRRPSEYFLDNVQIVPAYQGRGIGSALIRELQDRAERAGVPIGLQVILSNRARSLYERLGFVVTHQSETHYVMRWSTED
jgi:ribosomal protein S18 acetylase RimI-like enzyme